MTYYIGTSPTDVINGFIKRYMYGLRRNDDGELFLVKIDQLSGGDENIAIINDIGIAAENYLDFEEGIDYLAGINEEHEIVNDNLRYPQFKWDNRSLTYFIDPVDGQFIQRLSETYVYPQNISSPAYGDGPDSNVIITNTKPSEGY
jgi:hypothetical protein|tara:strand:- start:27183 stop:27620 length:438 start_codon:yes stop_codon:yes gene_type:complete